MKGKTVALIFLMVLIVGSFCATAVQLTAVAPSGLSLFGIFEMMFSNVMVLADPVPGGSGGGG